MATIDPPWSLSELAQPQRYVPRLSDDQAVFTPVEPAGVSAWWLVGAVALVMALGAAAGVVADRLAPLGATPAPGPTIAMHSVLPPPPPHVEAAAAAHETTTGLISITAKTLATIYVDGEKVGTTPIFDLQLAPGTHRVRAVSRSGKKRDADVEIVAGRIAPERHFRL